MEWFGCLKIFSVYDVNKFSNIYIFFILLNVVCSYSKRPEQKSFNPIYACGPFLRLFFSLISGNERIYTSFIKLLSITFFFNWIFFFEKIYTFFLNIKLLIKSNLRGEKSFRTIQKSIDNNFMSYILSRYRKFFSSFLGTL